MVVAVSSGDIAGRDTLAIDQDIVRRCGIGFVPGMLALTRHVATTGNLPMPRWIGEGHGAADDEPSSAVSARRVRL